MFKTRLTELLDTAEAGFNEYVDHLATTVRPLVLARDLAGWLQFNETVLRPLTEDVQADLQAILELERAQAEDAVLASDEAAGSQQTSSIVAILLGAALALGLGFFIAKGMARDARIARRWLQRIG